MSRSRITYSSSITVPVYGVWKCQKCGTINHSDGKIVCSRSQTTYNIWSSEEREAKKELAKEQLETEWAGDVLSIIEHPEYHSDTIRNCFYDTACSQCGIRPKWAKGQGHIYVLYLSFFLGVISLAFALLSRRSIIAWIPAALFLLIIVTCGNVEIINKAQLNSLPKQYYPLLSSRDQGVALKAAKLGKKLLSPEELMQKIKYLSGDSDNDLYE